MTTQGAMPAYPVECHWEDGVPVAGRQLTNSVGWATGLTKREVFAMAAMQGLSVAHDHEGTWSHNAELVAKRSVEYADALLAVLEAP